MIDIEIDGKKISVKEGSMIIEAADREGIYIPRFCYHKKLSIAANCRMCLVEVEKSNKPLPACATPATADMKIHTRSKMTIDAQRSVMEYLLINHPLDCPICDQGGECELQDLTLGYGCSSSNYDQPKRAVADENLGPLIETCMTRCIQCTRCVRFGDEVAGMRELGVLNRTEKEQIGVYVQHMLQSELSGNVIDLCPVGALVSKPYRFSARAWELRETPSISPHDCLGSNIYVHSRGQEFAPQRIVMRVVPRENEALNETWISDRDRFSYLSLNHLDRITVPKIKLNDQWHDTTWSDILSKIAEKFQTVIQQYGPDEIAALISPNATLEEGYLLQKWLRMMGSPHIDHRLRTQDFSNQDEMPLYPVFDTAICEIINLKSILLLGVDLSSSAPLILTRMRAAQKKGSVIMVINPRDNHQGICVQEKVISANIIHELAGIAKILADEAQDSIAWLNNIEPYETAKKIAEQLKAGNEHAAIFIGDYVINHPQAALIHDLIAVLTKYTQVKVNVLTEGANSAGAWLAGAVPHRGPSGAKIEQKGLDAHKLLTQNRKRAYVLLGLEPEYDCAYPEAALSALKAAEFVLCISPFLTENMLEYADIILPMAPFTETDGTLVNILGEWQSFNSVTTPFGKAKAAWKIIQAIAQFMQFSDFNYANAAEICAEIKALVQDSSHNEPIKQNRSPDFFVKLGEKYLTLPLNSQVQDLIRYAPWPMYRVDALSRRALPLQEIVHANILPLSLHPDTALKLNLTTGDFVRVTQGDQYLKLMLSVDENLAPNLVMLPAALEATVGFGQAFAPITLAKEE